MKILKSSCYGKFCSTHIASIPNGVDWDTIRQAHANIITGGCFVRPVSCTCLAVAMKLATSQVLGLRYAGTGCTVPAATLRHFLVHFKMLRDTNENQTSLNTKTDMISCLHTLLWRPDRPTLEMCLGATAIALGMVMAGTGDLASLRLLRELRWRVDDGITYGEMT